ncbi:MAG: acyl-ACP desaturase [Myxococcaceae bacterium]
MIEQSIKAVARVAYALNQSPAKLVLDPIYETTAAMLLRGETPLSKALLEHEYPDDLYAQYRANHRKTQYFIEDWDFSEARPELLTAHQRKMVHTGALGETSGTTVSDGFLRAFRTDKDLVAFFGTWYVEELNHFFGFHRYAAVLKEAWPREKVEQVSAVEFRPYADDPREIAACNMYQELVGYLVYRSWGKQVRDPFLSKMLKQFAKDEMRHFKFYQSYVARLVKQDPSFRKTVLKVFLKATTPFNQISGGVDGTIHHLQMGAFYFRRPEFEYFLDQVEFLLGTRLEDFFAWFFRKQIDGCTECRKEVIDCTCEEFEKLAAAA